MPEPLVPPPAAAAGIHPCLQVGDRVAAEVVVDGRVVAQLDHEATRPGLQRQPVVLVPMRPGLQQLQLRGTVSLAGKAPAALDRTWMVRDMAPASAPLYDPCLPWGERIHALARQTPRIQIEPAPPQPGQAALQALEQRLGTPVPALLQLLADWDIGISDSYFVGARGLGTVAEMLVNQWDYARTGEDGLQELISPDVLARYDRSLAVYVDVGDGLGALAWDPEGAPGEEGLWYWLHQDSLDEPALLQDHATGQPHTAEAAFTQVFQRFALSRLASAQADDELVVDTALPRPNLLQLQFDKRRHPRLWLCSYGHPYGLY
ncbi:hypothetical protein [Acidovorax sp. CF316]|uniref:hypothetical protein n=1 Tax=Acidovorax sp. CF316 TaxID=1144317 RepID=UPI001EE65D7B|nr:hypothetical protein [Acidovorax sp. CF316]